MNKTLPDQIADLLIALIFVGELKPGDKLPPERNLAEYLGVDRTSLRMALRTLTRMNVVSIVQGSGIRVLDYKTEASLDFLGSLHEIEGLELGGKLLTSGFNVYRNTIPLAIRMTNQDLHEGYQSKVLGLIHQMYQGLQDRVSYSKLADLDIQLVDILIGATDNEYVMTSGTSTKKLRHALTVKFYELTDIKKHLDTMVSLSMRLASGNVNRDEVISEFTDYINEATLPLKEYIDALPKAPRLVESPLKNGKEISSVADIMANAA